MYATITGTRVLRGRVDSWRVTRRKRVIYLEDDRANFALVEKVLRAKPGLEVTQAWSVSEALDMVKRSPPDLVLLDLDLPGEHGLELARKLKSIDKLKQIPVIAISASVMKGEQELALQAGCLQFIEKPFDINVLRTSVSAVLGDDDIRADD